MSRRKLTRVAVPALAALAVVALAVPATAQAPPAKVTINAVGKLKFVSNRGVTDGVHFQRDSYRIKKGGTITLVDKTRAPHSFSIVTKKQVPRNARQMDACFSKGVCGQLAVEHGAVNPETGEEQDPTTPLVNKGGAGFDRPGDSVLIPPGGKTKVKVTTAKTLYYICAVHPWMNGALNGKPVR